MTRELETVASDVLNGTSEERVRALKVYAKEFETVVAAAATVVAGGDPVGLFVADGVMRFARIIQQSFRPVFDSATDPEVKFLAGVVLVMSGSRESLPWLLSVASTPGPLQYDVTLQLGRMCLPEVRGTILDQLRSAPLRETGTLKDSDRISGLLSVWELTGEALPDDVLTRLRSEEAPLGVKVALKSLGWG